MLHLRAIFYVFMGKKILNFVLNIVASALKFFIRYRWENHNFESLKSLFVWQNWTEHDRTYSESVFMTPSIWCFSHSISDLLQKVTNIYQKSFELYNCKYYTPPLLDKHCLTLASLFFPEFSVFAFLVWSLGCECIAGHFCIFIYSKTL